MWARTVVLLAGTAGLVLALSACGGGAAGGAAPDVAPTAPPPPPPPPPATGTSSPPPIPAGPIGLTGAASFATYSASLGTDGKLTAGPGGVQLSYSAADGHYTITLPGYDAGTLVTTGGNGSWDSTGWLNLTGTANNVTEGSSAATQDVLVILDWPASSTLKYTSFGSWLKPNVGVLGQFVYGIPTAAGDVPVTGSATYAGEIRGLTDSRSDVWGTITLSFDFGAGTLSGQMNPSYAPVWDEVSLGTYTFTNTVYSKGSTTFSGSFLAPEGATGPSSFQGSFNGPKAAELMGSWSAPFNDTVNLSHGMMSGVFGAKKGP